MSKVITVENYQAKIDLKKLRERVADKDNPPHSDALKQSAWELLICCDPTGLRSLLDALDETRAALEFDMPMDGEDGSCSWCGTGGIGGYQHTVDCPFRRAQEAIAKLEEKFA